MIRSTRSEDTAAILEMAIATGLAAADQTQPLEEIIAGSLSGQLGEDHLWFTDDDGGPVGVAYCAPERLADGTWNLYMIAIDPNRQGQGRGTALLRHVEEILAKRGVRILIIDSSGLPEFDLTRKFYRQCGYDEEGRIRDFWKAGDDKIIFRKALNQVHV